MISLLSPTSFVGIANLPFQSWDLQLSNSYRKDSGVKPPIGHYITVKFQLDPAPWFRIISIHLYHTGALRSSFTWTSPGYMSR
jgi:hypothetical protein